MFDDLTQLSDGASSITTDIEDTDTVGAEDFNVGTSIEQPEISTVGIVSPGLISVDPILNDGVSYIGSTTGNKLSKQEQLTNPLHDYQSYTYCLSWHMLGADAFNSIVNDYGNGIKYVPKNVLVSSAGKWDNLSFVRNSNFKEDFYFENLKLKTVINTTKRNRNSNLIECEFTLIEPLGFTLINRLLAASKEIRAQNDNYIHMPYVLQIDFYGYKDGDNEPTLISDQTKTIPIRLTALKSKVTSRGTEYQVSAVPFNHQAFSQMHVASPSAFSVTGKTVKNFFGTGEIDSNYLIRTQNLQREEKSLRDQISNSVRLTDTQSQYLLDRLGVVAASAKELVNVSGYCDALNGWFESLVTQNSIKIASKVKVEFDSEIGAASLYTSSGPVNVAQLPAGGADNQSKTDAYQSAGGNNKGQLNFNGSTLTIPANTSIDKLIDWAVRNSSYIGDQIKDPTLLKDVQGGKTPTTPLKWFKIVPKVKIIDYDITQNKYALEITYYVKQYTKSTKYPYAPKGRTPGYVKKYDYLYTGKNKDVIDMQIDFDMMYYVKLSAYRSKQKINETAPAVGSGEYDNPTQSAPVSTNPNEGTSNPANNIAPVSVGMTSDTNIVTRSGGNPQLAVDAANLQDSLLLDARGDMINLDLKIIGDPQLIKQDDVFYGQDLNEQTSPLTKNGSLWMDRGELYVFVNFKSPVDYDESTGLADPNSGKYKISEYSGVYTIITIDNNFSRGKFEQTLNLVKLLYDQEGKPIFAGSTDQREKTTSLSDLLYLDIGVSSTTKTAVALASAAVSGGIDSVIDRVQSGVTQFVSNEVSQAVNRELDLLKNEAEDYLESVFSEAYTGISDEDLITFDTSDFAEEIFDEGFNTDALLG